MRMIMVVSVTVGLLANAGAIVFLAMSSRYSVEGLPRAIVRVDHFSGRVENCRTQVDELINMQYFHCSLIWPR